MPSLIKRTEWTCSGSCGNPACNFTTNWPASKARHLQPPEQRRRKVAAAPSAFRQRSVAVEVPAPAPKNGHSKPWESSLEFWDLPDHPRKWTPNEIRKLLGAEIEEGVRRIMREAFK